MRSESEYDWDATRSEVPRLVCSDSVTSVFFFHFSSFISFYLFLLTTSTVLNRLVRTFQVTLPSPSSTSFSTCTCSNVHSFAHFFCLSNDGFFYSSFFRCLYLKFHFAVFTHFIQSIAQEKKNAIDKSLKCI